MSPRSDDTPRRGNQPRRGTSRDLPVGDTDPEETEENGRGRGFGGIGDARAYTPRGRTMAERDQRTRSPRAGRTTDPFRPALQVLDGGRPQRGRRPAAEPEQPPEKTTKSKTGTGEKGDTGRRAQRDARPTPPRTRRPESGERDDRDELKQRRDRVTGRGARGGERSGTGRPATRAPRSPFGTRTKKAPGPSRAVRAVVAEPPKLANSTRRLRLGTVLALSLFVMIGVRLVVLQVASSPGDAARLIKLREQRITEVTLPAPRGSILDRDGTVLAHSVEARYVGADPVLVKDPAAAAAQLSPLLGVPQSKLIEKMTRHKRPGGGESRFEFLAQGVDISIGDRISKLDIKGIVVKRDERRDVPGADLAANLIGWTGADNSGLEGLEARYDSLLRGTAGTQEFEIGKGDLNTPIPGGYQRYVEPQPGTSLQLTIDADLQYEVQRILCEQATDWKATIAGAVVLDVKTGEVLAQASCPTYNAAKPLDYSPSDREDVPSAIVADPGSIHKAFVIGAALQEGLITPDSTVTVGPALERGGYRFQDSHMQPKGTKMTIPGILALSSNVGTILIGDKLGKQKVYEYQQKFGLGKATNEGMMGEATGKILTPDEWSGSASGSVPIGMSVDATLIQMAAGYAAIANDGTYIQPHLIKAMISGKNGKVTAGPTAESRQVLRPDVASELRTMMEAVVDEKDATGTQAAVTGYRVAGKTGTGKRLIDGQYTSSNYGSFIGMAPAENPRFVIAVSAEVAHGTGGDVAAPAFSKMMSFALLHYRVPPSSTKAPKFRIHP
ncbi:penicillin-binding transpeptidase domain-containing protein [Paractinoplanes durhamensis]|uniref:Cell division protein n=1 Tax=Paractinoplanes durhamensis TaxID=113563 RepID=A0ABQ3ZCU6_9ACTN|nr:penicillin-binding transpeptidase domain-containing protein [Actinoplanes durhamensis]GIE07646.1 cell division protein [Actinoplanes durhamensis]